jgi:WS/DGAT/MGAT family acyltransferase
MAVTPVPESAPPARLSALDATFLELEQAHEGAHMHIGAVLVFDPLPGGGGPTIGQVRAQLDSRLGSQARHRQKLSSPHVGGLSWPTWDDDDRFDVEAHVRHATLPAPGEERELLDWSSDFYSHRLDRTRPLWEAVLLDGLAGGRWAIAWKAHHCLVDGVGTADVVDLLLDPAPGSAPAPAPRAGSGDADRPPIQGGLLHDASALVSHVRSAVDVILRTELHAAPRTSINGPIGAGRRIETVRYPLDDLKTIRSALGGTVNDVVLSAATAGLRELLLSRGEEPPEAGLRALVPVNRRHVDEIHDLGNRVSAIPIQLPVGEHDPLERYERLTAATAQAKHAGSAGGTSTLLSLAELAPPFLHSAIAGALDVTRMFNLTVTNVPGPPHPLYAFGARMERIIPIVPICEGQTIGLAIVSYAGELTFGLYADRASVPDLGVLADRIFAALLELDAIANLAAR